MLNFRNTIFISSIDIKVDTDPIDCSVKVTHIPTSIVAEYNRYKSAHKNKIEALLLLREILSESGSRNNQTELKTVII